MPGRPWSCPVNRTGYDLSGEGEDSREISQDTEQEEETEEERLDDFLLISLRTQSGLNLSRLNENRRSQLLAAAENLPEGTLVREGDSLRIPESHWLRSDAIIRELLFG